MAVGTPTTNQGNGGTPSIAVPSGVAAGDIVVLVIQRDVAGATFTWPTGFTQLKDIDQTGDGGSVGIAWKRLTGADAGTYTFGATVGSAAWLMAAVPLTGRHATDPPTISTDNIVNTTAGSPRTITANQVTAVDGDDILFISVPDVTTSGGGNGHSSWTAGYTEIVDAENTIGGGNDWNNVAIAKAENVGAGATGSKTVTFTMSAGSCGFAAWLLRVPASVGAGDQNVSLTGIASAEAFGSITIVPGPITVELTGISSAEAFGTLNVFTTQTVELAGIPSEESFGTPTIAVGGVSIALTSIPSGEAFGTLSVIHDDQVVSLSGIPSAEAFGSVTIEGGEVSEGPPPQRMQVGIGL